MPAESPGDLVANFCRDRAVEICVEASSVLVPRLIYRNNLFVTF